MKYFENKKAPYEEAINPDQLKNDIKNIDRY